MAKIEIKTPANKMDVQNTKPQLEEKAAKAAAQKDADRLFQAVNNLNDALKKGELKLPFFEQPAETILETLSSQLRNYMTPTGADLYKHYSAKGEKEIVVTLENAQQMEEIKLPATSSNVNLLVEALDQAAAVVKTAKNQIVYVSEETTGRLQDLVNQTILQSLSKKPPLTKTVAR